jgi:serine protease Do
MYRIAVRPDARPLRVAGVRTVETRSSARLTWLMTLLVIVAVVAADLPGRLVSRWVYAAERGRLQATGDNLAAQPDVAGAQQLANAFRMVARVARPGVVSIRVSGDEDDEEALQAMREHLQDQLGERFTEEDWQEFLKRFREAPNATGSGILIDTDGHILTNNHVVGRRKQIEVQLADERVLAARLIGSDAKTDLAVIKIDADNLLPLKFGDSDQMEVGDWVLAIGSPFGLSQTVTHGIISAKGRSDVITGRDIFYQNFLQTDAAINPGNSGGPLVNLRGEVVGVNTAIATYGESYNAGVAFTIPSNMALRIANQLRTGGEVARGWLGVSLSALDQNERSHLSVPERRGVMVDVIYEGSPANQAGLQCEDVIVAVNGVDVTDMRRLQALVADVLPDELARLTVIRDGRPVDLTIRVGRQPGDIAAYSRTAGVIASRKLPTLDLGVRSMQPDLPRTIALNLGNRGLAQRASRFDGKSGVFVLETPPDRSDRARIEAGELLVSVNGQPVASVTELMRVVEAAGTRADLRLTLLDSTGSERTVTIPRD